MALRRLAHLLMLIAAAWCVAAHGAGTPADRLLAVTRMPTVVSPAQIKRDAYELFEQMNVPAWIRKRYELMDKWDVKAYPVGARFEQEDHAILVTNGSISIRRVLYSVIIAAGDVEIGSGAGLLVISGGNVRFSHDPDREYGGVFVAKGRFAAPWAVNLAVHAGKGAELKSNSMGVVAYNTAVRPGPPIELTEISGKPVFADSPPAPKPRTPAVAGGKPAFSFAGERCAKAVPIAEVADRVPKMARTQAQCADIDAVLVTCGKNGDEQWTVHICSNIIVDVRARLVAGRGEFDYHNPAIASIPVTSAVITTSRPPPVEPASPKPPPLNPELNPQTMPLFDQAVRLAGQGKREEAIALYEKVLAIDPARWNAHTNIANLKSLQGDPKGAVEHLNRAIELGARGSDQYGYRGSLLLSLGEKERGLADLDKAIQLNPREETYVQNRGLARLHVGDLDGAIADFDGILAKTPERPYVLQLRAWAYFLKNRPRDACSDAGKGLAMLGRSNPSDTITTRAAYTLIVGYFACSQVSESARAGAWFDEWRPRLRANAWPDAFVFYLRGEADEASLRGLPMYRYQKGEIDAFIGIEALQKGRVAEARKRFEQVLSGDKGYNLARGLSQHFITSPPLTMR